MRLGRCEDMRLEGEKQGGFQNAENTERRWKLGGYEAGKVRGTEAGK